MTGHLDRTNVGWVPLWSDVVVLHDACRVKVVNERLYSLVRLLRLLGHAVVDNGVAKIFV